MVMANPVIAMPRMFGHVSHVESASHMLNSGMDKSKTIRSGYLDLSQLLIETGNRERDVPEKYPFKLGWWKPTVNPYDSRGYEIENCAEIQKFRCIIRITLVLFTSLSKS
jgi:hypothetical protein